MAPCPEHQAPGCRAHPQRGSSRRHRQRASTPKAKTHSKGELHVFRSLIKRGKTTQCWQFSSSQPLPVLWTSNSCFPAGQPLPARSPQRAHRKVRARRRENSSFSQPGRERERILGKNLAALPYVSGKKKKNTRLFPRMVWMQKWPG